MSQIINKFIEDNAIEGSKLRLLNNQVFRVRNNAGTADVEIFKVSTSDIFEILKEVSMSNQKITNLADPTNALDAVNKQYLENFVKGVKDPKDAARVATTAVLPAVTYDNGLNGVGATLTGDVNGALPSIDNIGLSVGERILVKDQVDQSENGLYEVTVLGDAGTAFVLTRTTDADDNSGDGEVTQGMLVPVAQGTLNGGLGFLLSTPDPIVLGTTGLNFIQFGEVIVAGNGLTKSGSTLTVDLGNGLEFSGNEIIVKVSSDLVDGTTKFDGTGKLISRIGHKQVFTLSSGDITNGYIDISVVASRNTIILQPLGGPKQNENLDFTVSYQGGASSKTRITLAGDLIGAAALVTGDKIYITCNTLDY